MSKSEKKDDYPKPLNLRITRLYLAGYLFLPVGKFRYRQCVNIAVPPTKPPRHICTCLFKYLKVKFGYERQLISETSPAIPDRPNTPINPSLLEPSL